MRLVRALLVALIFGAIVGAAPAAASPYYGRPSLEVDVGLFYDDLAPYGEWVETADYGWGWMPRAPVGWRPYTAGHWVWTDEFGLLWVSSEPFGWAVYHYGRWYFDPAYGWIWIPGYEWGPSWVSFRWGGGYVGWAPLPPRAGWQRGVGFHFGHATFDSWIAPSHYCFVPERRFFDHSIPRHAVHGSRNTTIINITQNITNYNVVQDRVVDRSFRVDQLERAVRHAVPRARTVDLTSARSVRQAKVDDEVPVFRPRVLEARSVTPPRGKALLRRADDAPALEVRERPNRTTAPKPMTAEPSARHELEKLREESDERDAQARQELERRREQERTVQQRREMEASRQAEARRQLEKQQEEAVKRQAEARQELEARRAIDQQERAQLSARERQASARVSLDRRQPSGREPERVNAERSTVREPQEQMRAREGRTATDKKEREKGKDKHKDK